MMENNDIKFSILIPAFKKKFLKECIDSILIQTYKNFEIIIVNDASPENIDDLILKYSDQRIHYYKNKVGYGAYNVVDNWNKCLSYSSGDFVICIGDDDKLLPECLMTYYTMIRTHLHTDVFHIRTEIIDENSKVIDLQEGRSEMESVMSFMWHEFKGLRTQYIGDFLFRRSALDDIGGFIKLPYAWCSDRLSVLSVAENAGIVNCDKFGFLYRRNKYSITESNTSIKGKIIALNKTKKWYVDFLENSKLNREVENIYKSKSLELLDSFIDRSKINLLTSSLKKNPFMVLFWLKEKRKYNIRLKVIFTASIKAVCGK